MKEQKEKKKEKGKRAPWMEIALEEARNYGGYKEGNTIETSGKK
jgi:hypothetical protein